MSPVSFVVDAGSAASRARSGVERDAGQPGAFDDLIAGLDADDQAVADASGGATAAGALKTLVPAASLATVPAVGQAVVTSTDADPGVPATLALAPLLAKIVAAPATGAHAGSSVGTAEGPASAAAGVSLGDAPSAAPPGLLAIFAAVPPATVPPATVPPATVPPATAPSSTPSLTPAPPVPVPPMTSPPVPVPPVPVPPASFVPATVASTGPSFVDVPSLVSTAAMPSSPHLGAERPAPLSVPDARVAAPTSDPGSGASLDVEPTRVSGIVVAGYITPAVDASQAGASIGANPPAMDPADPPVASSAPLVQAVATGSLVVPVARFEASDAPVAGVSSPGASVSAVPRAGAPRAGAPHAPTPGVLATQPASGDPSAPVDAPTIEIDAQADAPAKRPVGAVASAVEAIASPNGDATARGVSPGALEATIDALASGPVRDVAEAVAKLAAPAPASRPADPSRPAVVGPARTLTLQLSPGSLGTVSIRLHLTGDALDVALDVSDPHTLGLLSRERESLVAALRDQATTVHSLTIQAGASPSPGGHDASIQQAATGDEAPAGGSGGRGGADERSFARQSGRPPGRRGTGSDTAAPAAAVDAGDGLFV